MPKQKESNTIEAKLEKSYKMLVSLIKGRSSFYDFKPIHLATAMRMKLRSYYSRVKKPGDMKLSELIRIGDKLKFTEDDILRIFGFKES